jgi:hypothetical protein
MLVDLIKKTFIKSIPKYEITIIESNDSMIKRDMEIYQKNGWELAGACATKFSKNGYYNRIIIPLKRKIK